MPLQPVTNLSVSQLTTTSVSTSVAGMVTLPVGHGKNEEQGAVLTDFPTSPSQALVGAGVGRGQAITQKSERSREIGRGLLSLSG